MKVLIYGINFYPELTGIGKYTGELARWLSRSNHEVTMITAPPYYPEWEVGPGYSDWKFQTEETDGITVIRCPLWVPQQPGGVKRILHLMSFALSSSPALFWSLKRRPDVIVVIAPAFFCAPAAWLAARLIGAKCWLHIQDFEVDAAFDLGLLKGRLLKKWVLALECWLLRRFDRVSTISDRMLALLQEKLGDDNATTLFPNWVDLQLITPLAGSNPLRRAWSIPDDQLVLLYSGNMGQKQGLETVIEAARSLDNDNRFLFLLCGDGVARNRLQELANGIGNIRWLPLQPVEQLNHLLNLADIHLLPQSSEVADLVMPSKLSGMLASGKPIIATALAGTQVAKVVSNAGLVVPPDDVAELVAAILALAENASQRASFGQAGRTWIEQHWDKDLVLKSFKLELKQLIGHA